MAGSSIVIVRFKEVYSYERAIKTIVKKSMQCHSHKVTILQMLNFELFGGSKPINIFAPRHPLVEGRSGVKPQ